MVKSGKKGPIVNQIAKQLGLSRSAIYFALAGSNKVSEATRRQVYQLAESLGYQPNLLARSLSSKKTGIIGVIMPNVYASINIDLVYNLDTLGNKHGYKIMYACSFCDATRERELLNWFVGSHIEGLILCPASGVNAALYAEIAQRIPVVIYETYDKSLSGVAADILAIDNFQMGYMAGQYLIRHGRSRILYFSPAFEADDDWRVNRLRGLKQACNDEQVASPMVLTIPFENRNAQLVKDTMSAFLENGADFDGLFAANDMTAHGAILALKEADINIPDKVAVIGCDNDPFGQMLSPRLTTMRMPMSELGTEAFKRLRVRIETPENAGPLKQVFIPAEILPRESCGELNHHQTV